MVGVTCKILDHTLRTLTPNSNFGDDEVSVQYKGGARMARFFRLQERLLEGWPRFPSPSALRHQVGKHN